MDEFLWPALTAIVVAATTFIFTKWGPTWLAGKRDQQEFTQTESEELRRHKQGLEVKKLESGILRSSWREDKLAEELERSTTFIREVVYAKLKEQEQRLSKIESLLENYRQLAGILAEIRDDLRSKGRD